MKTKADVHLDPDPAGGMRISKIELFSDGEVPASTGEVPGARRNDAHDLPDFETAQVRRRDRRQSDAEVAGARRNGTPLNSWAACRSEPPCSASCDNLRALASAAPVVFEPQPAKPFLKWFGGKRQLLWALSARVPQNYSGRYFEPFLAEALSSFIR